MSKASLSFRTKTTFVPKRLAQYECVQNHDVIRNKCANVASGQEEHQYTNVTLPDEEAQYEYMRNQNVVRDRAREPPAHYQNHELNKD